MIYDYAVIGMGPTGINIALELSKLYPNKKIICIEKENSIGGCWRVEWDNNLYTEHAPKVIITNTFDDNSFYGFLKKHNFDFDNETVNLYGNIFETNKKVLGTFLKYFSIYDIIKIIKNIFIEDNSKLSITEWSKVNNISTKGIELLRMLSILTAGNPDNVLVSELFNSSTGLLSNIKIFKNSEKWLRFIYLKLKEIKNITLLTKTELVSMTNENNIIKSALFNNNKIIKAKEYILTIPLKALYVFLTNQTDIIKNNFGDINKLNIITQYSSYYSFGFQLHFDRVIKLSYLSFNTNNCNNNWCCTCFNDYNLIIIPISELMTIYTKDEKIKTVWSCCIVNTSNLITKRNKTIDQLTADEIFEDIIDLLPDNINPMYITLYDGVVKENGKWISKDSSFSTTKYGIIDFQGHIDNLYSVGLHNTIGTATINKAIKNSNRFIDIKIKNIKYTMSNIELFGILLIFIIFIHSVYTKVIDIDKTYQIILNKNIPFPFIATYGAIVIEFMGIYFVYQKVINNKFTKLYKLSLKGLIIFMILATYYFHNVITDNTQIYHFFKNLSIIGGLLILYNKF